MRLRFPLLIALTLSSGVVLGVACEETNDDVTCTENGGTCVNGNCYDELPYSCGSGGTCCKPSPSPEDAGSD
jgi:hypothetical protein